MNRNITLLWIEVGKLLAENPDSLLLCPICAQDDLLVKDSHCSENPSVIEREMSCPSCGARNYLRLVRLLE